MRVLFIGNSHTYYNDMPHIFAGLCSEKNVTVEVTMLAHGGKGWDFHLAEPEVRFNILYGGYDAVVLQHVAHPMGDLSVMDASGRQLIQLVKEAGARPILYMTWTTKADGEDAQESMSRPYRKLQQETGCELAPVGERWWEFHRQHPDVELYAEDGRHASPEGSRLAASVIAETFLHSQHTCSFKRNVWDLTQGRKQNS